MLRAEPSEDRNPMGERFSLLVQTGHEAHPASCTLSTASILGVEGPGGSVYHPPPTSAQKTNNVLTFWAFGAYHRENVTLHFYMASVVERVWSIGGMILTVETKVLGEKHYRAWMVDEWMHVEHWWSDTDRGNWSTGRKTLYSVGGRWMNEYGALVEWYWQGKLKYWEENIIQRRW